MRARQAAVKTGQKKEAEKIENRSGQLQWRTRIGTQAHSRRGALPRSVAGMQRQTFLNFLKFAQSRGIWPEKAKVAPKTRNFRPMWFAKYQENSC